MTRALITGAAGMVGRALTDRLREASGWEVVACDRAALDISSALELNRRLDAVQPDVVFNAAAFTQVDLCEVRADKARLVNGEAPGWMAQWCAAHGALLVQLSTDYVLADTGKRAPLGVDARVGPVSVYGRSKLIGEQRVALAGGRYLTVRTAWVFSHVGRSFLQFVLEGLRAGRTLPIVTDQTGSPTYAPDLADALVRLVEAGATGVVHFANSGSCTWYELAMHLRDCAGIATGHLEPVSAAALNRAAPRPVYSVLATQRYIDIVKGKPRDWQAAAAEAVTQWSSEDSRLRGNDAGGE